MSQWGKYTAKDWGLESDLSYGKDNGGKMYSRANKTRPRDSQGGLTASLELEQQEKVYVLPGRGKKAPKSSEHKEQRKVFKWASENEHIYPELAALFAVPNAAKRSRITGAQMKAEGLKPGVSDIHLPSPVGGYCGLWIEMKYGYNNPTQEQKEWIDLMRWIGHRVEVCYSAEQAIDTILDYITNEYKLAA